MSIVIIIILNYTKNLPFSPQVLSGNFLVVIHCFRQQCTSNFGN